MAAQRGRDLLLKIDTTGTGSFSTVAGLRTRAIALNAETVDITHQESAGQWRELLGGAGARSARISGSGIFKDAASDAFVRQAFFNGDIPKFQIVVPDFGTFEGPFQISSFELSGRHDSEVTFEMTLESAGVLTFTAL
ncbi:MAG: phage major tail protein, TP901-1 family [Pseudomonadota bacterium]